MAMLTTLSLRAEGEAISQRRRLPMMEPVVLAFVVKSC